MKAALSLQPLLPIIHKSLKLPTYPYLEFEMKTAIVALVLAQAISILAAGKCCTRQARNDIPTCQANGYWASCVSAPLPDPFAFVNMY